MTDARRQADEAIARYLRLEASIHTLQNLSGAERALLQGLLPDVDDLAVLRAAFRCEREEGKGPSAFTAAFGLAPKWRTQSRSALIRELLLEVPTSSIDPCPRATEIERALKRHVLVAHDRDHPLSRVIIANGGKKPSFSVIYRALFSATPPIAEKLDDP